MPGTKVGSFHARDYVTNMLSKFKSFLSSGSGHENIGSLTMDSAVFRLDFDNIEIGILELNQGKWIFRYSDQFRNQDRLSPLVDFPSVDKVYQSKFLWPFFSVRIPSLEQPAVKRIIQAEHIDENNEAQLLERFGKHTVANPFNLIPAAQ